MKNILKYAFAASVIALVGCEPEFDNSVTDSSFYSSGEANFARYVAVGNSLTAGYADGALYVKDRKSVV